MIEKGKGLNLTEHIAPEEEITVGDIKLKIKGTVPDVMFDRFKVVQGYDPKKLTSKNITDMTGIVKELLVHSGSKSEDVEMVFQILDTDGKTKLIAFIGNFLKGCYQKIEGSEELEDFKKKENS